MRGIAAFAKRYVAAAVLSVGIVSGGWVPVGAQQSAVTAQVCNDDAQSSIVVESPQSDIVVQSSKLTIRGQALQTSQIEISIDGDYVRTVALPSGTVDFSTTITLKPGTQTIRLDAQALCSGASSHTTLVITYRVQYRPGVPAPPSPGSDVPTTSNPNVISPGGGQVVSPPANVTNGAAEQGDEQQSDDDSTEPIEGLSGWLEEIVQGLIGWTGYELRNWRLLPVGAAGQARPVHLGWWLLVLIGVVAAVSGRWLVGFVGRIRQAESGVRRGIDLGIRLGGVALIAIGLMAIWLM